MLLVCSAVSLSKDWVQYEIERALKLERERNCRIVFPIMVKVRSLKYVSRGSSGLSAMRYVGHQQAKLERKRLSEQGVDRAARFR